MSVLNRIFDQKRAEVADAKARMPLSELKSQIWDAEPPRGFRNALLNSGRPLSLIAEVKKASPSKGLIRPDFDPREVALAYERAGVQALSVLTDGPNFQGSPENLKIAKAATKLPCLRKDFVNDPYQVYEARAWGADAVLLILAALEPHEALELHNLIEELGMDALVEVHNPLEADVSMAIGAKLIGVNNRDLADFKTDLAVSEQVLPMLPKEAVKVSESALETFLDLERVRVAGANAVLIGTTFCASPDIEAKVGEVMGWK
jgi:indole-3-glycerol phosphate synthase